MIVFIVAPSFRVEELVAPQLPLSAVCPVEVVEMFPFSSTFAVNVPAFFANHDFVISDCLILSNAFPDWSENFKSLIVNFP